VSVDPAAPPTIDVAVLPELARVENRAAVMIDVLRASSTIVAALDAGCASIHPVAEVDDARRRSAELGGALLCGERGGAAPEGFDLGNSPGDYTPDRVGGRELVLTTTNGTRALDSLSDAAEVLIGSITNRDAVAGALIERGGPVVLVCAGTEGRVSLDDIIAAGLIAQRLAERGGRATDAATLAIHAARDAVSVHGSITNALGATDHGARLIGLGLGVDVEHAARVDISDAVPRVDREAGVIRAR